NIKIINADILNTNINEMISDEEKYQSAKIIGNLPYYITTPIIMKILEEKVPVKSITIMVQKEVADRLKAEPGGKDYGALSVAVQYYCDVTFIAQVPRNVFIPKPNVDSSVIRLDVREIPSVKVDDEKVFFRMVKAGFSQRRKTLLNALSHFLNQPKEEIEKILIQSDIDPLRRAETLSLQDFAALSNNSIK
ncbi:MAG: 16S rRNA (adenine(1518)-N(6)/adenine(1519)-N(6))-dimethyltransferase RsmA, partial [Clostridia bacterium]|nr:16S rRNA (adenine(1518)-N(6)/adenine(1519)-N(6))-dimethyltransferase RsmA [Clostridia bacterium]